MEEIGDFPNLSKREDLANDRGGSKATFVHAKIRRTTGNHSRNHRR